jgi:dipeptidase E
MRLFLSSYRAGDYSDRLVELLGRGTKVAVVTNAKDYQSSAERPDNVMELLDFFVGLGMKPTEIDLRKYFKGSKNLKTDLQRYTAFWLAGGNVFLLRRALNYSGLDKWLYDAVRKNEIILGGESAGAIIMGPTLKYSEVDTDEDSPNYIPEGYDKEVIWNGLDFITYVAVPHYKTPDYIGIDEYIENLEKDKIPYKTMTDGQAILINDDKEEFLE